MFAALALEHDLLTFNLMPSKTWHRFIVAASENLIYLPWLLCSRHVGSEWMYVLHICNTVHWKSQNTDVLMLKSKPMLLRWCVDVYLMCLLEFDFTVNLISIWMASLLHELQYLVFSSFECFLSFMNSHIFENVTSSFCITLMLKILRELRLESFGNLISM